MARDVDQRTRCVRADCMAAAVNRSSRRMRPGISPSAGVAGSRMIRCSSPGTPGKASNWIRLPVSGSRAMWECETPRPSPRQLDCRARRSEGRAGSMTTERKCAAR